MSASKSILFAACTLFAILATSPFARAGNYDETLQGDLSGVPASPTIWNVSIGANSLKGSAGTKSPDDYDLVSFTVPAGARLDSILMNSITPPVGDSGFLSIQPGTPWLDGLGYGLNGYYILNYALVDASSSGSDLLATMLGYKLADGTYTFHAQDVDGVFGYQLTFNIVASPVPGNFDGNSIVDAADLTTWTNQFGTAGTADVDSNGKVEGHEFLLWQQSLGSPAITAAPEPTSAALALVACALLRPRRRK